MALSPAALLLLAALAADPADAGEIATDSGAAAAPGADAGTEPDAGAHAAAPKSKRVIKGEKRAPAALLSYLRRQTVGDWCARGNWGAPAPLEATRFLELRGGGLLFFAQVPDYLCNASNRAVPVVVSTGADAGRPGAWRWGAPIAGAVTHVAKAEDGTLWASSQWQIEGTYPMLFTSRDGVSWKVLALPEERATAGPVEELTALCFGYQTVVVKIESADETNPQSPAPEVWSRDRKGEGAWSREVKGVDGKCLPPLPVSEHWTRDDSEQDRVLFLEDGGKRAVSLPKLLRPY